MVKELWDKLVTSLKRTPCKHDIIKLWVTPDQGTSYMLKFMLYSEPDMTILKELLSTSHVMIETEDLQKLNRAGLVLGPSEKQECCGSCTPRQGELDLTPIHEAWNDET